MFLDVVAPEWYGLTSMASSLQKKVIKTLFHHFCAFQQQLVELKQIYWFYIPVNMIHYYFTLFPEWIWVVKLAYMLNALLGLYWFRPF